MTPECGFSAQETLDGEIIVDGFAGGGGASTGIETALGRIVNAAERDIRLAAKGTICDICTHSGEDAKDKNSACWDCTQGNCKFEWRGPQEAGEGEGK